MHLRSGEEVLKTIKRHKTPYFLKLFFVFVITTPFFYLLYFVYEIAGAMWTFVVFGVISFFVGIIVVIISLDYILDKLVLTNKRVVWVNWKSLFSREDHEVELSDIQDAEVKARGILSKIPGFDYGALIIETAASRTAIHFNDCPHPDIVQHDIVVQTEKIRHATPGATHPPAHTV